MQQAPLLRRDAEADAESYFEERAAHAEAYALPDTILKSISMGSPGWNLANLDSTTVKLGRRSAKSTSSSTSKSSGSKKSGSTSTKKPDRVGQVINNAGPVLNGIGSIIQGVDGLVRRDLIMEEAGMPLVYQRSAKSTSSGTSKSGGTSKSSGSRKSGSTNTKKPDRVGQVINNAGPVLNGIGSVLQGVDGLVRRDLIVEETERPIVYQRSVKSTSSSSSKTHTSSSTHPDHVGQVINNAGPVLSGVGSIIQGIDGLVHRDLTMQEVAMLHARNIRAHERSAKSTSSSSSRTHISPASHPDHVGQVINNAGPVLSGIGSIVQGIDGLVHRDLTKEEIAFLNARDLRASANQRRSNRFQISQSSMLQNKVPVSPKVPHSKREAELKQSRSPKHMRRAASVSSYFQQLERDVENVVGTIVSRDAEAEAEAESAREVTIQPNSITTTTTDVPGSQVVNTVNVLESAKNGTSNVEIDPKKKTTEEKEGTERKHPKEMKAKEEEKKAQEKKGRENKIKEQKHREKLQEEKIAKEKSEIKKLGKAIKAMDNTATGIKSKEERLKKNSTANVLSAKKADLNEKPVPSISAQVAKVAARTAEIIRSWTGLNE